MHRQQFCLIADRESRVTVKAIALCASHSCGTGGSTLGRVLNACFNDCAKHSWLCTVSSSVRFLIADRASRVTVKPIALQDHPSHCGRVINTCFNDCANILGCAPSAVLLIADRESRVTVKVIALRASHSGGTGVRRVLNACLLISWLCTVSSSADRESRVTVKAIALRASHSWGTGGSTLGRVLNVCFNDCANILGCAPSAVLSDS